MYRITTKKDGFRRAGRAWHGTTDLAADALTPAQLAALKAEPQLIVDEIADVAEDQKAAAKTPKGKE